MQIVVTGTKNQSQSDDIKEAAEFFADILMDPRMVRNIVLDININKMLDVQGECINDDGGRSPRFFTINLRNKRSDESIFKTLSHEMVHLKQYAKNELQNGFIIPTKNGLKIASKWMDEIWQPKRKEHHYFDAPWEIAAYGMEVGLYHRWLQHKEIQEGYISGSKTKSEN